MWTARVLCVFLLLLPLIQAGTFLSASVRWAKVGDASARFEIVTYWRRSFTPFNNGASRAGDDIDIIAQSTVSFNFGDGSPAVYLLGHVTDINEADDWLEAVSVLTHAYPEPNLRFDGSVIPWEASFSGCCRFLGDEAPSNDAGGDFLLVSSVDFAVDASPDLRTPPRVYVTPGLSLPIPAPLPSHAPDAVLDERAWRFCAGMLGANGLRTNGNPLPSSVVVLNETSGELTWLGNSGSKYSVCIEARRLIDPVLGTYVYSQQDFMVEEQPTSVPVPQLSTPGLAEGVTARGFVGYRFSFAVQAELPSPPAGASNLMIVVGYKSRAEEGALNSTGMQFETTSASTTSISGQVRVPVVADWNEGWFAVCFYAAYQYEVPGSSPAEMQTVGSGVHCVDVVFAVDTQPQVTLSADAMFADPLNRPHYYSVAEGQELRVRIQAFKPPTDDEVRIELASGPEDAVLESESTGNEAVSVLSFTPTREMAGATVRACVTARGAGGSFRVVEDAELCVNIDVRRCVWTVQEAESMVTLAQALGVSWLQLWNFNKATISRPDFDLQTGQVINVGQLYAVDRGDTLYNLAERFSTTMAMIERMNADVAETKELVADRNPPQLLCITFNSCTGATVQ